jgi:hypothetical protein
MEALHSTGTSVMIYQTARRHIPDENKFPNV